jgi:hypothetical protein
VPECQCGYDSAGYEKFTDEKNKLNALGLARTPDGKKLPRGTRGMSSEVGNELGNSERGYLSLRRQRFRQRKVRKGKRHDGSSIIVATVTGSVTTV